MKTRISWIALFAAGIGAGGYAALDHFAPWERFMEDDDEEEPLYYRHPHDSSITSDEPKQDSMGMDYIPVYPGEEDEVEEEPGVVTLSRGVTQAMNVRTAEAESSPLSRTVETVGHVVSDEARTSRIDLRTEGWIEELTVARSGTYVETGDVLFRYFSPRLLNAQEEFLQAEELGDEREIEAAERRLRALGLSERQVATIRDEGTPQDRFAVRAPRDGFIQSLEVREGDRVAPGDPILEVTDLSEVWVMAEVFEQQGAWLRPGLHAEVESRFRAGESREGALDYVYPELATPTRTTRARIVLDNEDGALRPGMYTRVEIHAEPTEEKVHVPREAVIRTGSQERVILALDEGRFKARAVEAGTAAGGRIAVEGLEAGERVVTSGQFLIDSEADRPAALARLDGADEEHITAHGVLEEIDEEAGEVTITHDPIPELDWPEMTMPFEIGDDVDLEDLAPGDAVIFAMEPLNDMAARLTAIEADDAAEPEADSDEPDGHEHH